MGSEKITQEFTLSAGVSELKISPTGSPVTFKYKLIDEKNQEALSTESNTYTRANNPNWGNAIVDVTDINGTFKPLSDTEFLFSHLNMPLPSGSSAISYDYELKYDNSSIKLAPTKIDQESTNYGATIWLSVPAEQLMSLNDNREYKNVTIVVTATDGFGAAVPLSSSEFIVDFKEAPEFGSSAKLSLRHDFNRNGSNNSSIKTVPMVNSKSTQMFNPGEGIVFVIPKASDLNNDIVEYRIYKPGSRVYSEENINSAQPAAAPFLHISDSNINIKTKKTIKSITVTSKNLFFIPSPINYMSIIQVRIT